MTATIKSLRTLPWYGWLLVPFVLPAAMVVMIPLGILALFSIPYYFVFPDHHRQIWDFEGTPHQRELLVRWRLHYEHLGFIGRVRRAFVRRRRRRLVA